VHLYFFRKTCSFLSEEIMGLAGFHASPPCLIISSEKMIIFSEEIMRQAGFHTSPPVPHYFFRKKCSFFSEEIRRQAGFHSSPPVPHYFFRKKCSFFSEEIMRQASPTPNSKRFIISSEKNVHFFLKK
jgi:hypothetical protein